MIGYAYFRQMSNNYYTIKIGKKILKSCPSILKVSYKLYFNLAEKKSKTLFSKI